MLIFKPITIMDQEWITTYIKNSDYPICDLFFPNLFMWNDVYHYAYAIIDGFLVIMDNDNAFYMPLGKGDIKKVITSLLLYCKSKNFPFILKAITPEMFLLLDTAFPHIFTYTKQRDHFDYVYASENLIELHGKHYQAKRNHIHHLTKQYVCTFEEINDDNIKEVLAMHENWILENQRDTPSYQPENLAVHHILLHYKQLPIDGGLLRIGKDVVAFSFGAPINRNVYDICIEKAFHHINGLYSMINQSFAEHFCSTYTYINREDDLGIPGLRKAKLSYHPTYLLEKGIVQIKEDSYVS